MASPLTATAPAPAPAPSAPPVRKNRVKGVSLHVPIAYGSIATPVKPEDNLPDPSHTHKWTVFLKGETDLSYLVQRIDFKLHESFANANRQITKPPYEVSESGWGEFEIIIKIVFIPESGEKPISLSHHLQLYNKTLPIDPNAVPGPVECINYDELVFNDPTAVMHSILMTGKTLKKVPLPFGLTTP